MKDQEILDTSLEADTRELCQAGGRVVGSSGHEKAERFVARRLKEIGCEAYRGQDFALPYEVENQKFCNFAGIIPGRDRSLAPLLIGAHYDSVIPEPCADDNGAAVAICFALAKIVEQAGGLQRDLLVTIFDAEEPPHFQGVSMGSNRFYVDQLDGRGVQAAVVFDLVGQTSAFRPECCPARV